MGPLLHKFFKLLLESSAPFVLQHMPVATLIILTASFPYNSLPQDTGPVSWQGPWAAGQRPVRSDDLWGRVAPLGRSKDSVYVPKSYLCVSHAFQQHIPNAFAYILYSICVYMCTYSYRLKTKKHDAMVRTASTSVPRRRWLTVLVGPGSPEHLRAIGMAHDIFIRLVRFCLRCYHESTFTSMSSNSSWPRAVQSMPFCYNCDFDSRQTHEPCAALKFYHPSKASNVIRMCRGAADQIRRARRVQAVGDPSWILQGALIGYIELSWSPIKDYIETMWLYFVGHAWDSRSSHVWSSIFDPEWPLVSRFESLPPALSLLVSVNQNEPRKENITESIRPRFWCATSSVDPVWRAQCFTLWGAFDILDIFCHSKRGFVLWAKCVMTVETVSHWSRRWQRLDNRLPWSKPHTSSFLALQILEWGDTSFSIRQVIQFGFAMLQCSWQASQVITWAVFSDTFTHLLVMIYAARHSPIATCI